MFQLPCIFKSKEKFTRKPLAKLPRKRIVVTMFQMCVNSISSPGQQMRAYLNICPDERDMCPGSIISHEEC